MFAGLRRGQTEHRRNLDIVSRDARGIIKVAPIFYWSEQQLEDYMATSSIHTVLAEESQTNQIYNLGLVEHPMDLMAASNIQMPQHNMVVEEGQ